MNAPNLNRRSFLFNLARISAAGLLATPIDARARISTEKRLKFLHTHTKEKLDIVYFSDGHYLPGSMLEIRNLLRDHRTDETHPIDPALFDILYSISRFCSGNSCFQVISGYRSSATNDTLRRKNRRVARN
ncbi:MAG: DUF882 domain-containing protein, partial [Methylococcales bacterium]